MCWPSVGCCQLVWAPVTGRSLSAAPLLTMYCHTDSSLPPPLKLPQVPGEPRPPMLNHPTFSFTPSLFTILCPVPVVPSPLPHSLPPSLTPSLTPSPMSPVCCSPCVFVVASEDPVHVSVTRPTRVCISHTQFVHFLLVRAHLSFAHACLFVCVYVCVCVLVFVLACVWPACVLRPVCACTART